jgi:hypothetical protein
VWRDILLATGLYAAAHGLLFIRGEWNQFPSLTTDVAAAQLCFVVGTLLIWRCTRQLCAPEAPLHRTRPKQAACCLALAMALSFSPCLWWFVFRW